MTGRAAAAFWHGGTPERGDAQRWTQQFQQWYQRHP